MIFRISPFLLWTLTYSVYGEDDIPPYSMVGSSLSAMSGGNYQLGIDAFQGMAGGQSITGHAGISIDTREAQPIQNYLVAIEGVPGRLLSSGFSIGYQTDHRDIYIQRTHVHAGLNWKNWFLDLGSGVQAVRLHTLAGSPGLVDFYGRNLDFMLGRQSEDGSYVSMSTDLYSYSSNLAQFAQLDVIDRLSDQVLASAWAFEDYSFQVTGFSSHKWGGWGLDLNASHSAIDGAMSYQAVPSVVYYPGLFWEVGVQLGVTQIEEEPTGWFIGSSINYWF